MTHCLELSLQLSSQMYPPPENLNSQNTIQLQMRCRYLQRPICFIKGLTYNPFNYASLVFVCRLHMN